MFNWPICDLDILSEKRASFVSVTDQNNGSKLGGWLVVVGGEALKLDSRVNDDGHLISTDNSLNHCELHNKWRFFVH